MGIDLIDGLITVTRLPDEPGCAYDERWPGRRIGQRGDTTCAATGTKTEAARCRPVFSFGIGAKAANRTIEANVQSPLSLEPGFSISR